MMLSELNASLMILITLAFISVVLGIMKQLKSICTFSLPWFLISLMIKVSESIDPRDRLFNEHVSTFE